MAKNNTIIDGADPGAKRNGILVKAWRRRGLFTLVFALVMALTVAALIVLPVRFLATGSVIVAEQEPGAPNASAAWAQKIGDPADLESQLLVIRSSRIMRLAIAAPGAYEAVQKECLYADAHNMLSVLTRWPASICEKLKPDSDALIDYVEARYKVGTVGRSRVINVSYQSPLPDVAQRLANLLITAFLDDQRSSQSTSREEAAAWLWQELRQLDAEVRDADAKIQAFRRAKGLMRGQIAPISAERLTSGSHQLTAAETARAEAAARLREIQADQARGSADAPAVLASRAVADLKQQMTTLSAQLASATFVLGPKHPSLQALQREYDILKERLANEIASVAASAQKAYDAADALVASLKSEMESIKADAVSATADEASIESMVRGTDIKRQKYSELYKRASELETERRVLVGSTRLVSMAELPSQPFFPKRVPFLAAGFAVAFLLGFGAALLRDRSDRSVRASSELAVMTGAPIFAQLPRVSPARTSPLFGFLASRDADLPIAIALKSAPDDPILQDALRKLYAGVVISNRERLRTILVTSARPREGKTFTTLALAQLVAATGRRVLVVECDMRAPTFVTALGLMPSPGLAAVLRGILPPREVVVRTGIPNLDAIPAGRPTVDSTELLMSKHVGELLRWAESYDLVLLDSPPSDMMMDARMLAKEVDGVLYCARWGHTSIASAAATIADIRAVGGDVFGVAITMVKPDVNALYESVPGPNVAYLEAS